MPKKLSNLICPKCKRHGGTLSKTWVKHQTRVPNISKIKTIADSFDAIGKMYLKLSSFQLLLPPDNNNYDQIEPLMTHFLPFDKSQLDEIINNYYHNKLIKKLFSKKIKKFRIDIDERLTKYEQNNRYKNNYLYPLRHIIPIDIGKITRMSIASLCYALVCFSLRDIFCLSPFFVNGELKYAHAIYKFYKLWLHRDRRDFIRPLEWADIILDSYEKGDHAATSLNRIDINVCKNCSKIFTKYKEFVIMENTKNQDNENILQCPLCRGQEKLQRKISSSYLKEIKEKKEIEIKDWSESLLLYIEFIDKYSYFIRSSPERKDEFTKFLKENEEKFFNNTLDKIEYYSIGHYNPKNQNKSYCRFSDLSEVKLVNPKYQIYEEIVSGIGEMFLLALKNYPSPSQQRIRLQKVAKEVATNGLDLLYINLEELQFPKRFVEQKIQSDLILQYQKKKLQ